MYLEYVWRTYFHRRLRTKTGVGLLLIVVFLVMVYFKNGTDNDENPWCQHLRYEYPLVTNITAVLSKQIKIDPINLHRYHYLYKSHQSCEGSGHLYLLTVVKSRVDHFDLRRAIRRTLGQQANANGNRMVFTLGYSYDDEVREAVHKEFMTHKDIIQGNFIDKYHHNIHKTTMTMGWIAQYCRRARFVLLLDDDMMVNFEKLLREFKNIPNHLEPHLYAGNLKNLDRPIRDNRGRWTMPMEEFPYQCYPPYISGGAILMTSAAVQLFNSAIPYVKQFKFDDIFLSIVAQKLGIVPYHIRGIQMNDENLTDISELVARHGYSNATVYKKTYIKAFRTEEFNTYGFDAPVES